MKEMLTIRLNKLLFIFAGVFLSLTSASQEWSDWRGSNRDGIWKETGIIKKFESADIPLKWSVPCGPGYSGPTVSGGKVYLTDRIEKPEESERVLCIDANDGKTVWTYTYASDYGNVSYPNGPRASVVISEGKAYSLGTMGHLFCFDAQTGKVIWQHDLNREYRIKMPIWGIAATPLIYKNKIILHIGGSNGASVLALDKNSGKELWRSMDDKISYSAPILIQQAGKPVVVVWTEENLNGLDAETGKVYWKIPFAVRMGMGVTTPVQYGDYLFVSCFFSGSLLVKLSRARLIEPTTGQLNRNGIGVTWTHPAFANRHVFVRNDNRLVCAYLGE